MCLSEFVVESCVYYGCVPGEISADQNGFPLHVHKVSLPTRQRSGYATQLAYLIALMRRMTR